MIASQISSYEAREETQKLVYESKSRKDINLLSRMQETNFGLGVKPQCTIWGPEDGTGVELVSNDTSRSSKEMIRKAIIPTSARDLGANKQREIRVFVCCDWDPVPRC
jgi:hypothetical protein